IFVERAGQQSINIGDNVAKIKQVGIDVRKDMEVLFERKIRLTLWGKVKSGWSDDERALAGLGY
ncbi:KH domain-containing protein, partial [Moraxella catarrhalis]|uniref:KH domain-containing protein n=1 Tax=Moraxella catarrhalis TaxID=480 RepID=UPI0018837AEA